MRFLVVGARHQSLGQAIFLGLRREGHEVVTWGISGQEDKMLDLREHGLVRRELARDKSRNGAFDGIVCTAGLNMATESATSPASYYRGHFEVNVLGPINLFYEYVSTGGSVGSDHFVAISSNSAHIARRYSGPYCASKAALSMALRVLAREGADNPDWPIVYGYEFGLLAGTPMTEEAAERFEGPLTRMPGLPNGIPVEDAAAHVVRNLLHGKEELNGVMLRLDAGEQ